MPSKPSVIYTCTKCDAQSPKWSGRCESCGSWGTIPREPEAPQSTTPVKAAASKAKAGKLQAFEGTGGMSVTPTGVTALDLVLGGGVVSGSVTLLAGEPGIGKSTILAELAVRGAEQKKNVIYVTGEESPAQVERRLARLTKAIPSTLQALNDTSAATIAATMTNLKPDFIIVDSVQTLHTDGVNGEPGSISQVKASCGVIAEAAKRTGVPTFLVGQVTKEGDVAGPRALEHLVDTLVVLEGDRDHDYRILRTLKHRFGATDETALLEMTEQGLIPVADISEELLKHRTRGIAGSIVTCLVAGARPIAIEIQALVSSAGYSTPTRRATGIDAARLTMILAVLARRGSIHATDKDVFANAAGGIDARDPSMDLAVAAAIASGTKDIPIDPTMSCVGEIGLAGEIRPVRFLDARIKELGRMGFKTILVPKGHIKRKETPVKLIEVETLRDALQKLGI